MIYTMFDLRFLKDIVDEERGDKRLLVDFDRKKVKGPNRKDINIEEEKLKEDIIKPKLIPKVKKPKKGSKLF